MGTMMTWLDPREVDAIHVRAGQTLRRIASPQKLGRATGRKTRTAQAWCAGEKPSPLARCAEMFRKLTAAGLSPFAGLAFLEAECAGAMMQMSDDALVERFWALMDEETAAEGALNKIQQAFIRPIGQQTTLDDIIEHATEHGTALNELRYVARELRRRQIDPRTHKPSRVRVGRAS